MRRWFSFLAVAAIMSLVPLSVASPSYCLSLSQLLGHGEQQGLGTFKLINITDLKDLMANTGSKLHLFDANVETTRAQFGTIPGSVLLDSDDHYSLSLLPQDKHAKLVFYCANSH
jgi:hypothetical protein